MKLRQNLKYNNFEIINFVNCNDKQIHEILEWRNNEFIRNGMFNNDVIELHDHLHFIKTLGKDNKNFYWIVKTHKDEYIGVIYINNLSNKHNHAYLGIYTNPKSKLKGNGSKLLDILTKKIFEEANLHTLKLEVIDDNKRAIGLYKKFGFETDGILKEFVFKNGQWKDVIIMGYKK